jgi:hypothetical protein
VSSQSRSVLTYGVTFVSGAVLFFLSFAAIFNGSWALLLLFLLCYPVAGAVAVGVGRATPVPAALVLTMPALPWILWLFSAGWAAG